VTAPGLGDAENEMRPPSINVTDHATEIRATHVWTDEDRVTHGCLSFGTSWIVFHDPAQAREAATALQALAEAMGKRIAEAAGQDGAK